jgi:hypothetical protein
MVKRSKNWTKVIKMLNRAIDAIDAPRTGKHAKGKQSKMKQPKKTKGYVWTALQAQRRKRDGGPFR